MANRREIRLLTRFTDRPPGGRTLYFTADALGGRTGRCKLTFIDPEHVPAFDGRMAWFELERVPAAPWPYWRAIRRIDPPAG